LVDHSVGIVAHESSPDKVLAGERLSSARRGGIRNEAEVEEGLLSWATIPTL